MSETAYYRPSVHTFNGTGEIYDLPQPCNVWKFSQSQSILTREIPKKDGALLLGIRKAPISIQIEGLIIGANANGDGYYDFSNGLSAVQAWAIFNEMVEKLSGNAFWLCRWTWQVYTDCVLAEAPIATDEGPDDVLQYSLSIQCNNPTPVLYS